MPRVTFRNRLDVDAPAYVATLWVDGATGDDTRSKATVAGSGGALPWATIGRAAWGSTNQAAPNTAEAAAAGDVVSVAAGTYSAPGTGSRFVPALNPANSGTSGNHIVFVASGAVNIGLSSSAGPTIGFSVRNYITWSGFSIDEANGVSVADTGSVTMHDSTGGIIERCTIDGNGVGHGAVDNHNGIRVEAAVNCIIRNCTIHSVTSNSGNPNNGAGIMGYANEGLLVEHCKIYSCGSGIFLKGGPNTVERIGHTIRFNILHDITGAALIAYAGTPASAANPTRIHQNIVYNAETAFRYWHFNSQFNDPTDTHFINNVAYNVTFGFEFVGQSTWGNLNNSVWNNIVSVAVNAVASEAGVGYHSNSSQYDHRHNVYHSVSGNFGVLDGGATNVSLATWQGASYLQDDTSPAAVSTDPGFTNVVGRDFHVVSGYALTHGRAIQGVGGSDNTTIPAGAYITGSETIGVS